MAPLITLLLLCQTSDQLIDQGLTLREQGKDQQALELFQKAYAQSKTGKALTQIALAEQALGRWVEAEKHLIEAIESGDPWVTKRKAPLEGALDTIRERLGSVEVLGKPAGAKVLLNGKEVGALPLPGPIRVVAGSVVIDVMADGYRAGSRSVTVKARGLARETIDLVPNPGATAKAAPPPPAATPPIGTAPPTAPPPPSATTTADTTKPEGGPDLMIWGVVAGGAALAGVGLGVAGVAIRNSNINGYNDDSVCLIGGLTRDENCSDKLDAANTGEALAITGFVLGGAFAVTSVLLFVFDGGEDTVAIGPGPGDAGLSAAMRW